MTAWQDALAARDDLATKLSRGLARKAAPFVCEATTFGGPHDQGTGYGSYKGEDLRKWTYPSPYACAELSTNYTASTADLDYRAIMMQLPVAARRELIAARVIGDPATGLPHRWPFLVSLNAGGHTYEAVCAKLDIGRGGVASDASVTRAVDLFWPLAAWLGVENVRSGPWSGIVTITVALP